MLISHVRHGFRLLAREPGFTAAALLTLALGVGGNTAVFAVVEAVLLRPLPYAESDRLVVLTHRDQRTGITKEFIAVGDHVDLAARQDALEPLAGYGRFQGTLTHGGETTRVAGLQATAELFETLRVQPILGRALQAGDTRPGAAPVALLGYDLWQERFGGDRSIVGRGVIVNDTERQIVGVAPRGFTFPVNADTQVILPLVLPLQAPAARKSGWTFAVARLKAGGTVAAANAALASLSTRLQQEFPRENLGSEYYVVPLRDALVGDTRRALVLLLAAVGVVLLIACVNVANLLLARSLARRQEMAVRVALGAGRRQLVAQLLAESLVLGLAAGAVGVVFAHWGTKALVSLVPTSVNVAGLADVRVNLGVLLFALAISLATALAFGLVSAATVRASGAAAALGAVRGASTGRAARRATSALVAVEVALAVVLLIGAGLILRTFAGLLAVDPGFRTEGVLTLQIAVPAAKYPDVEARGAFYRRAMTAIEALPAVERAGGGVVVPLTGNNWTVPFERIDRRVPAGERPPEVGWQAATGGFFQALGIPLLAGRLFDDRDGPKTAPVVIVSEAIQRRYFPGESAVGKSINLGNGSGEIVGVVGNIRRSALTDEPRADMYFPFERFPQPAITLFVRTAGDAAGLAPAVVAALRDIEPAVMAGETRTMSDIAAESLEVTRLALWLLGLFAAAALALAAVGIYGVLSYIVRGRTRELGTRLALGATRGDILRLVLREGASITAVGAVLGLAAGLAAARVLSGILYGVTPSDPLTVAAAAALLVVTAMAACYVPARRAAAIDPARTLVEP